VDEEKQIWNDLLKAEQKARSTRLNRLVKRPLRYPVLMGFNKVAYPILKRGVIVHAKTFFGVQMKTLLPAGTDVLLNGIKSHDSEIRLTKFLVQHLKAGDTFIDVGAHYGYYALLASTLTGDHGHVHAIEASAHSFELLKANTIHIKNIKAYHNAAGESPGEIVFYEYPGPLAEYNTIIEGAYTDKKWFKNVKQTINRVQTILLDDLINANQINKAIIKIDVEGGELAVIKGLVLSLQQSDLTIVMEYLISDDQSSPHHQAVSLMVANGYQAHAIDQQGHLVKVEVIDQYLREADLDSDNLVFVKG
jgi:FkbM family methyltransferase